MCSLGVRSDEQFGKVADDKYDVFDIGLCGEVFEQPVADGTRNEEGVALCKKAFVIRSKQEDGLDAEVMDAHIAIDNPEAIFDSG